MPNPQVVHPENLHRPSPEQLRSEANMKEFQIKKLVEFLRIVPTMNMDMLPAATQLVRELVEAEQELHQAKYKIADIKSNLARLIR